MQISSPMGQLTNDIQQARQAYQNQMAAVNINEPEQMLTSQFTMNQYSAFLDFKSIEMKMINDIRNRILSRI
ncbi:type III secretion system needle filament subunit SctF [Yersinia pseudotuberculosis]|uniref:type III secretion system needle filament subunit SctF n=1 Tax=Yersinia pseudotuberculosis TaxID=633 RepID=UPI00061CA6B2|nr:type III secretion system needle filament subunit SctF [Yersinia pseudotuberculosis]AXY34847.1 EscF/YscF/HrpA family type III secretion system needle major subunit [Yersinia pseudotuberculosis]AYX10511.1 EscF/YscF/HrpA family type III secretion system needle major subunit [Yersinia pseudotuberculosis]MBO1566947.1 EscF/YscF/HrpA family type III secretion system needle major subunit [Yersinia pseudotuberculosis]MBO1590359.1 EscF/YscF/HrpA family type III secretion system needle major subunit [